MTSTAGSEEIQTWESVCLLCVSGFELKQDFINESQRLYDSEPAELESLQQINEWVEKATQGKMTDFLSALPPNLLLMLINAVHFKGEWEIAFPHIHLIVNDKTRIC